MSLNLSKSNWDPCNITEVYKPNLAAGKNAQKGISFFFVLALEAGGKYDLSGYQTPISEVMATSGPLNLLRSRWRGDGLSVFCNLIHSL